MGRPRTGAGPAVIALACGTAMLAPGAPFAARQATGTIKGTVATAASTPEPIKVTVDEALCGKTQPDPSLVVGASGGVANAVVRLVGSRGSASSAPPIVLNRQCRFVPHVLVVAPGATIEIKSEDPTLHTTHAYSESGASLFNIALPVPGLGVKRRLDRAQTVRLACDTHPWMRGFVVVTTEATAVTDADGRFTIESVPEGTFELRVWHETLRGAPQRVTVQPGGTAEVTFVMSQ